ncbi:hypothetical protein BD410DRAFT_821234 [Rickenella mellea]|uniref:GET complex, subunit GET2 n=1 Tax=Rickenella mellea TaxID=50990 RepID=A0A4Y7Q4R8_9AGAM|nr:hypothetical protein BD410DRAFT_821234 [Rickenella mellea]
MVSAADRAEARRKAILSRGSDRLAKLTTSARGENHPVYAHDDPPLPTIGKTTVETFLGEETNMPRPPPMSTPSPPPAIPGLGSSDGPTAWTPEQQAEIMRAFMGGGVLPGMDQNMSGPRPAVPAIENNQSPLPPDDPMSAMMQALAQFTGQAPPGVEGAPPFPGQSLEPPKPKSMFQKLMPVIHLGTTWILLAYFVLIREPEEHEARTHAADGSGVLQRWADLRWRKPKDLLGVQTVPFFWAFVTMQLVLHSTMLFTKLNPLQPPTLVALALPHLPPTLRSIVINVLTYVRMGGMLLDDIAGFVLGIGILVYVAGWLAQ